MQVSYYVLIISQAEAVLQRCFHIVHVVAPQCKGCKNPDRITELQIEVLQGFSRKVERERGLGVDTSGPIFIATTSSAPTGEHDVQHAFAEGMVLRLEHAILMQQSRYAADSCICLTAKTTTA